MAGFLDSIGLGGAASKYIGLKGKIEERGENMTGEIVKVVEVSGSTFLMAYANGFYAKPNVNHAELSAGVPADMTIGFGLLALGLMGFAGKFSDTICNLGTGTLGAYAARMGTQFGAEARLKKAGVTATKGMVGAHAQQLGAAPVYHRASMVESPWNVPVQ